MDRPKRPARNFQEFANRFRSYGGEWLCIKCHGSGIQYIDPPDVEGYKYARTRDCPSCNGSGRGTKAAVAKKYRETLADFKARQATYRRYAKLRAQALQRLTKEEITALRELGI